MQNGLAGISMICLSELSRFRLFVVGRERVGKTLLLRSINEPHTTSERLFGRKLESPSTVGIEIGTTTLENDHQVQTWDLGGQEVSE